MSFTQEDLQRKITLKVSDEAPKFSLKNIDGVDVSLCDFVGKKVVLYFYPKDLTPGCSKEACEFTQNYDEFLQKDVVIIGISPDNIASHQKFKDKFDLKHILLSDEELQVCKLYGVYQVKKNFGKEYLGIVRTTFIIDENGKISKIYKNVKVADHAKSVLKNI